MEKAFNVPIKHGVLIFAYAALSDKFVPLGRYHRCGDYKHGVALPRLVGSGFSTFNTIDIKVAVEGRALRTVGACMVVGNTGVRS